ncbi:methylosome subunit pICln-like [Dysidea avara]|uniref:methylosome subunit pICln-like n=1 Tax=Dysidea avara TaxID=196820 RepID=UPI0033207A57
MEDLAAAASNDKLVHEQKSTKAFIQDRCLGEGTLCIRESLVSWSSSGPDDFQLEYPRIAVHAICRDVTQFPHECLYLLISPDTDVYDDEDDEDEPVPPSIVRFVPEDKTTLEAMFAALSQCQALHPDPEEDSEEEEQPEFGAGEYFTSGQDVDQLSPEGQAILERLNNQVLQMPGPGEFEQLVQEDNDQPNGHVNGTTDNYEDAD